MQTIAITGATSGIGVSLTEVCLEKGYRVIALVRKDSEHIGRLPKSGNLRLVDMGLEDLRRNVSIDEKCDVFFHLAWLGTDKSGREAPYVQQANIKYTLDALYLAKSLQCRKFIATGSQAEYGPHTNAMLAPTDMAAPNTAYGISKYAAGQLGAELAKQLGIDFFWVRVFSVYGRYDRAETMLRSTVDRMKKGEKCAFTEGTQIWDYLYCDDAAKALLRIGEKARGNKIYCLGSGQERQLKEYIIEIRNIIVPQLTLKFGEIPFKPGEETGICADISSLQRDTGWRPETSFASGMRKLVSAWDTLQ